MKALIRKLLMWAGLGTPQIKTSSRSVIKINPEKRVMNGRNKLTTKENRDRLRSMEIGDELIFLFDTEDMFMATCDSLHSTCVQHYGKGKMRTRRSPKSLSMSITRIA